MFEYVYAKGVQEEVRSGLRTMIFSWPLDFSRIVSRILQCDQMFSSVKGARLIQSVQMMNAKRRFTGCKKKEAQGFALGYADMPSYSSTAKPEIVSLWTVILQILSIP